VVEADSRFGMRRQPSGVGAEARIGVGRQPSCCWADARIELGRHPLGDYADACIGEGDPPFYDLGRCDCPPSAFFPSAPPSLAASDRGGAAIKGGFHPFNPRSLSSPQCAPPRAMEPRAPDRAMAALTASLGDLPRGAGQEGGQQGVMGHPLCGFDSR